MRNQINTVLQRFKKLLVLTFAPQRKRNPSEIIFDDKRAAAAAWESEGGQLAYANRTSRE